MMTIGTKIKNLRDSKKMSQVEFAMKLGIGQTTLGSIESGETKKIDFLLMDKICKEFNVDSDYFKDDLKLSQTNNGKSTGYIAENQYFTISEKLLEQYEERIKELKQRIFELENK